MLPRFGNFNKFGQQNPSTVTALNKKDVKLLKTFLF